MGVGTAVAVGGSLLGGHLANEAAEDQADATRHAAEVGAAAADPFASQRGFYQNILRDVYSGTGYYGQPVGGTGRPAAPPVTSSQGGGQAPVPYHGAPQLAANGVKTNKRGLFAGITKPDNYGQGDVNSASVAYPNTNFGDSPGYNGLTQFIQTSPDYQFRMQEGQRAIERSAAAGGMLQSGNLLRDLVSFGQGQASSAFESEINRIMTMAGATIGSPGVAGQLASQGASQAAAISAQGQNTALQQVGYGLTQGIQAMQQPQLNAANSIQQQTGYSGGVQGVLSGDEWSTF